MSRPESTSHSRSYTASFAALFPADNPQLVVIVKIRFAFPDATIHNHIVQSLQSIRAKINTEFNNKFEASGDVAGVHFDHCLVHFFPRFLVENLVIELTNPANVGYLGGLGYTQTPAPPGFLSAPILASIR